MFSGRKLFTFPTCLRASDPFMMLRRHYIALTEVLPFETNSPLVFPATRRRLLCAMRTLLSQCGTLVSTNHHRCSCITRSSYLLLRIAL
jgi:hypothetical protein